LYLFKWGMRRKRCKIQPYEFCSGNWVNYRSGTFSKWWVWQPMTHKTSMWEHPPRRQFETQN